jgi:hypothetical protein
VIYLAGPITAAQIEDVAVLKTENFKYVEVMIFDPATDIETGADKAFVHIPFAGTLVQVHAQVGTPSTVGDPVFDIKKNGGAVLSTPISIDAGDHGSHEAITPPVISDDAVVENDVYTFNVTATGTGTKGLTTTWKFLMN